MKKIIKIVIALFILIVFKNVNAVTTSHRYFARDDFMADTGIRLTTGGQEAEIYRRFVLYDENGKAHSAFCIDPGLSSGKKSGETTEFTVKRVLLDPKNLNSTDEVTKDLNIYDYGMVRMLSDDTINSDNKFVATQFALREYSILMGTIMKNISFQPVATDSYRVHSHIAWNELYTNRKYAVAINIAAGRISSEAAEDGMFVHDQVDVVDYKFVRQGSNLTTKIKNQAESIFVYGINSAKLYRQSNINDLPSISFRSRNVKKENNKYTINYTVDVKNMNGEKSSLGAELQCTNCRGLTPQIYVGNELVSGKINLLKYLKNGTGTVKVSVVFNIPEDFECDSNVKYKLTFTWSDIRIPGCAEEVQAKGSNGTQRFIVQTDNEKVYNEDINICSGEEPSDFPCTAKIEQAKCEKVNDSQDTADFGIYEGYSYNANNCDSNKEDIKRCVIGRDDQAGNAFETDLAGEANKYCTVYCKEDYNFSFPNAKYVNSGRYFVLNAEAHGKRSCYTGKINTDKFNSDLTKLQSDNKKAYDNYVSNPTEANEKELTNSAKKLQNAVDSYKNCTNWKMDYEFKPRIYFHYDDSYMSLAVKNEMDATYYDVSTTPTVLGCTDKNIDNAYSCSGKWKNLSDISKQKITYTVWSVNNSVSKEEYVIKANYVKQTMQGNGKFITPTQFYNTYPSGNIAVVNGNAEDFDNIVPIQNGLPTSYSLGNANKEYRIYVSDAGMYSDGTLGRIWGNPNSVLVSLFSDEEVAKCVPNGDVVASSQFTGALYRCRYVVNCPDCPLDCGDEGCEDSECNDYDCPVECIGCIVYGKKPNYTYRPVSSNDFNPTGRTLGPNWNITDNSDTALKLKAMATTDEITSNGDKIFDSSANLENNVIYKIKLDSKMIAKIRKYNKEQLEKGGYLNNTLKCYDYKNEDGTVSSLISKEEFYSAKSKQIIDDSYSGSLPAFVAAFISNKKLTAKEADEIQKMIDEFKKN